jgi:hypothetical protein
MKPALRRSKLSECLFSLENNCLEPICQEFGIHPIAIDADLNVALGKTGYPMLSASEQF